MEAGGFTDCEDRVVAELERKWYEIFMRDFIAEDFHELMNLLDHFEPGSPGQGILLEDAKSLNEILPLLRLE